MILLRSFSLSLFFGFCVLATAQAEKFECTDTPLISSFIDSDKTWFQDAVQSFHGDDRSGADGVSSKAGFALTLVAHHWAHHSLTQPGNPYVCYDPTIPVDPPLGHVLVDVLCAGAGARANVGNLLDTWGAGPTSHWGDMLCVWIPHGRLIEMASLPEVLWMRPAHRTTRSGLVTSQGDTALRGGVVRAIAPGFSGAGITIGTLSDSFSRAPSPATSAAQDVANGDLPENILVLEEIPAAASDEGRAMMQLIHDIAPGAAQQFHTAFNGQASFAQGIRDLADSGCDIIVDDVLYFAEPFFQPGIIAQAVSEVTDQGVAYFSSAGNSGRDSYEDAFRVNSGQVGLSGGFLHDFDEGPGIDSFQSVTIPVGETVTFVLQWDEPFASVSGLPGSQNDIDIFLTGSGAGQFRVLSGSAAINTGGDPVEIFTFTNAGTIDIDGSPGADTEFNLVIERFAGNSPGRLKYIFFDNGLVEINEFRTDSSTLVGHANTPGAFAIGASPYFNTPAFGVNPPVLEPFSSPGGNDLRFNAAGQPLTPPLATGQPRLVAPDGGNTTFFGSDLSSSFPADSDGFPNFFGTSAAAPHAAAVAALLLEKTGGSGSLSPSQLDNILRETAINMGPEGSDLESGAGLIDAEAALNRAPLGYATFQRRDLDGQTSLTSAGEDPDRDRRPNLIEFFTGTSPLKADSDPLALVVAVDGSLHLRVTVLSEVDPSLGKVETSTDLVEWTPLDLQLSPGENQLPVESGDDRRFFRLEVFER